MSDTWSTWKDKITHEIETRVELIKLGVMDRVARLMGYFIFMLICIFTITAVLIISGLALGELFADITGSYASGYLIAAGIYLLLLCILFLLRKFVVRIFGSIFIRLLTDDGDD